MVSYGPCFHEAHKRDMPPIYVWGYTRLLCNVLLDEG